MAKEIGGQAQLGGNYAVDVVLRVLEHTDGLWVEGYTRDTLKVDAPPGSRFLGWLLYDREGGHYKAVQYSGGSFFLLDSLNRQPKKLTAGETEDELGVGAGKQRDGRRHFRVFCLEGATLDPPQSPPVQSSSRKRPSSRKTDAPPTENPKIRTPCPATPAVYQSLEAFREAMRADVAMRSRLFVHNAIACASVANGGDDRDDCLSRCVVAMQEWGFLRRTCKCESCGRGFALKRKVGASGKEYYVWRGPRPNVSRDNPELRCACYDSTRPLAHDSDLVFGVSQSHYLPFLDTLAMHLNSHPKKVIYGELEYAGVAHSTVDEWVGRLQLEMTKWVQWERKKEFPLGGWGKVVQIDETNINRKKRSALNRAGRRRKQRWVWGAVEQGRFDKCHLRILPDPGNAIGGKSRGLGEIELCIREAGIRPGTLCVTDGWKASGAVDWDEFCCAHDFVIHSRGEIVNRRGAHTNLIEAKWSSLKRWMRSMCGGVAPHGRRLEPYVFEYQWRQMGGEALFAFLRRCVATNRARALSGAPPVQVVDPKAYGKYAQSYLKQNQVEAQWEERGEEEGSSDGGSAETRSDEGSDLGGREFRDGQQEDAAPQQTPGEKDAATLPGGKDNAAPERRPGGAEAKRHEAKRQRRRLSLGRKASDVKGKAEQNRRWKQTASGKASKKRERKATKVRKKEAAAAARELVLKKKKAAESAKNKRKYAARKAKERQDRGDATA